MIPFGRPILIALGCLLSILILANRNIAGQIFISPEIPSGQTIGDISGSGFEPGSFVPGRSSSGRRIINAQPVPRFDTSADDSGEDPETMVFGPVGGTVPAITRGEPLGDLTAQPGSAELSGGISGGAVVMPRRERRETSARRSKADISEMPGREIIRQRYSDGNVQIARHVKQDQGGNFVNDGQWQLFDRTGVRVATGAYVDGAMEGNWARLHSKNDGGIFLNPPFSLFQGPFTSRASFTKGKISGHWRITDAKGRKIFEMPYKDGRRDGLALWFYPGDKVFRRMQFADNVPDGQLIQFDQRGKVTRKEVYQDGKRIENRVTYYRPSNQKQEAKIVLRGRLELNGEDQWWDAEPAELVVTGEDSEHGPIRSWYQNGQTKMAGNLENGSRVGRFVWWHENGVKQSMGSYDVKGEKTGQWIWWHANGMKSIMGQYKGDEADGLWRQWDQNGQQVREKTFDAEAAAKAFEDGGLGDSSVNLFGGDGVDRGESIDIGSADDSNRADDGSIESMIDDRNDLKSNNDMQRPPGDTDSLEDISPAEMEEELPSPYSAVDEDSSAIGLNQPSQTTEEEVDRFFQINF